MRDTKASGTHAGGVCSLLATSAASSLLPSLVPSTPTHLPAVRGALLGAGMRFLAFDLFRDASRDWAPGMHSALRGGLAGCVGGLAETVQSALLATLSARSADRSVRARWARHSCRTARRSSSVLAATRLSLPACTTRSRRLFPLLLGSAA